MNTVNGQLPGRQPVKRTAKKQEAVSMQDAQKRRPERFQRRMNIHL